MLSTTLTLLKEHGACAEGYKTLAKALGRGYGKDTPIPLARIVETNNLVDALWTMQAVPPEQAVDRDRIERLLACDYAEHVLHLFEAKHPTDLRPRQAIEVARRFAVGDATQEELAAAWAAAEAAAWAAAGAAWAAEAAWAAAGDAGDAEREWQTARFVEAVNAG